MDFPSLPNTKKEGDKEVVNFNGGYSLFGNGEGGFKLYKKITDEVYFGGLKLIEGNVFHQWNDLLAEGNMIDLDAYPLPKDDTVYRIPKPASVLPPHSFDYGSVIESQRLFDDTLESEFDHELYNGCNTQLYNPF